MRCRALAIALAMTLGGGASASAAQTTLPIRGEVKAIAFAGDALIVARQPSGHGLTVDRLTPGAATQTLLNLPRLRDVDTTVVLAASAQGLAVSVLADNSDDAVADAQVFVGSPAGPLRAVTSCAVGLLPAAVAVSGARIAWSEGGCGEPADKPLAASPVTIVIGAADPAMAQRRLAVPPESLPITIVLDGQGGLTGLLLPSFFSVFKSEVRQLGDSQLGDRVVSESARIVLPGGVLTGGETVFAVGPRVSLEGDGARKRCDSTLFVLAPGASQRRALPVDGCPVGDPGDLPTSDSVARVIGDRVYTLVEQRRRTGRAPTPVAVTSVRGDGSLPFTHARGSYRPPLAFAVDEAGHVGWVQQRCAGGGSEIVIEGGAAPAGSSAIPSCAVKLLDRSARVRGRDVTLRLRCPSRCSGRVTGRVRRQAARDLRAFSFQRGTQRLRLRLTARESTAKRLRLRFVIDAGPTRTASIRLR